MSEDRSTVLIDEREVIDGAYVKRIKVIAVPNSQQFPEGIKYRMHYGTLDGETILRYDNSHGVHERHEAGETTEIDFPGYEALYRLFTREIEDCGAD